MSKGKKAVLSVLVFLFSCACTACGERNVEEKAQICIPVYEKKQYDTCEVQKGDLDSMLELMLTTQDYRKISYTVEKEDLEIDTIYVAVGDKVKKGDTLISFKSGDIESQIESYENQLEEDTLLIAHYKRVQKLGKDELYDMSDAISDVEREMKLLKIRIEEAQDVLKDYSVVAEADGTISDINDVLLYGYVVTNDALITQTCGSDNYQATTQDTYPFETRQVYTAKSKFAEYEMKLVSVCETEKEGERSLIFEPVSDMSGVSESDVFTITIKKQTLSNVVYVSQDAVSQTDGRYFVYTLDENGFRDAIWVEIGETIDDVTIITSGLSGGEQVVVE